jgi:hypothetical protein
MGFELAEQHSAVDDFYDERAVREIYYREVEDLVARRTGADRVVAFDHNLRCLGRAKRGEPGIQGPIKSAHNDYTARSATQRVRDLIPGNEAEERLRRRFAVVNVWRSMRDPVEAHPLAICDATSLREEDMIPVPLEYPERTGVVQIMSFDPGQRWFYYPRMQQNEVLLLDCFDSAATGRAPYTGHTAFEDPTTTANAADRESIEVRTLVFY